MKSSEYFGEKGRGSYLNVDWNGLFNSGFYRLIFLLIVAAALAIFMGKILQINIE